MKSLLDTQELLTVPGYIHTDTRYFNYLGRDHIGRDSHKKFKPHLSPDKARELIEVVKESVLHDYELNKSKRIRISPMFLEEETPLYRLRELITYDLPSSGKLSEDEQKTAWGLFRPYGDSAYIGVFTTKNNLNHVWEEMVSIARSKRIKFDNKFYLTEDCYPAYSYDVRTNSPGVIIRGDQLKALDIVLEHIKENDFMLRRLETSYIDIPEDKYNQIKKIGENKIQFDTLPLLLNILD
jgi:hypothetical protein